MITRAISALIALVLLVGSYYFYDSKGVLFLGCLLSIGCIFEYSKLSFARSGARREIRVLFFLIAVLIFFSTVWLNPLSLLPVALGSVLFLCSSVLYIRRSEDLNPTLDLQSAALVGFLYVAVFSGLAMRLLTLSHGAALFFGLLLIVFSGDTFAYLSGRFLGKTKLLEAVSPKKTIAGALGGLMGSMAMAAVFATQAMGTVSVRNFVLIAFLTGFFAQVGDLFESLLKRVADVKDSGAIMPGHGGVLDRLDGVLFGAPVYYLLTQYLF
jgi:phosphatidate cytidylyltransferase